MRSARRGLVLFSAAFAVLAAVLALVLPAGIASAAAGSAAETRVWAFSSAAPVHVRADRLVPADQRLADPVSCPFCASGACVAPEDASALAQASNTAFKAADNADGWTVSAKHLAGAAGRWAKFAEGTDPNALVQEALRSPDATFLPNSGGSAESFIVRTDLGRVIGTNGQTALRVVVSSDGRIITAFPVK